MKCFERKNFIIYIAIIVSFLAVIGCIIYIQWGNTGKIIIEKKFDDGSIYKGYWQNGQPHGEGILIRPDSTIIQGIWDNGIIGYAIITNPEYHYEGGVKNLKFNGFGILTRRNGQIYRGNWSMDKKHGLGLIIFEDGRMDFGEWEQGILIKPEGKDFMVGHTAYGIDVSHHQPIIEWNQLCLYADSLGIVQPYGTPTIYLQPVLFTFIKSTEGNIVDPDFDKNFQEAKRHGIIRGAYHFLGIKSSVREQIDNYISHTTLEYGDLPPVLDLEVSENLMKNYTDSLCSMAHEWLKAIEKHYDVKPIIYTYDKYYNDYLKGRGFDDYPIWIARFYGANQPSINNWKIWQFTDKGTVGGIQRTVDINRFNGSYKELLQFSISIH